MDQSPKAKFLRAKYIARERERLWYWRVYLGLKTCCLQKRDTLTKKGDTGECLYNAQKISVPLLVEIQRMVDFRQREPKEAEAIKRLIETECSDAIKNMTEIHRKVAMNQLTKMKYTEENLEREEEIERMHQDGCKEKDCRPWARRKHYYNEKSYELRLSENIGDDEKLPYYKPFCSNDLEQGFKPWARRRHYFNHTQSEEKYTNNLSKEEILPVSNPSAVQEDGSKPWARRRHYYNKSQTILDTVEEDYKPWARRRHYYNEGRNVAGSENRL